MVYLLKCHASTGTYYETHRGRPLRTELVTAGASKQTYFSSRAYHKSSGFFVALWLAYLFLVVRFVSICIPFYVIS